MGVLLGLLSGITYGAADFIGGLASRRSSTLSVVVISQLSGLIVLLILLPVLPKAMPSRMDLVWGVLAGLGGAVGITLLYRGLAVGRMSVVSPITAVIAAIIPLVVGLALGERPSTSALSGVALALVAVVFVSTSQTPSEQHVEVHERAFVQWLLQPGLVEALLSGLGVGAFLVCLARTHASAGLWPLACSRLASIAVLVAIAFIAKRTLKPARGSLTAITGAGILDMLANTLYLLATRYGMLSIVAVLASLYPASTVLLARVVLHERLSKLQLAGVACALVAIALIATGTQGT